MSQDLGKLVLRLTVGILMLLHGIAKIRYGVGGIAEMIRAGGGPGGLAYLVYVGEVFAPLLVVFGLWTRPAALVMVVNMIIAIGLAHAGDLLALNKTGGWAIELQAFYLFGALAIALLGAGRLSLGGAHGRFN
jgi:putative oxidoreductase